MAPPPGFSAPSLPGGRRGPAGPLVAVPRGSALPRRFRPSGSAPAGGQPRPAPLAARPHKGLWAAARASRGRIQRHGPGDFVPARDAGVPRDRHRAARLLAVGAGRSLAWGNRGFRDRWCSSGAHRGVRAAAHGRGREREGPRGRRPGRIAGCPHGGGDHASPSSGHPLQLLPGVDGGSRRLVVNPQAVFPGARGSLPSGRLAWPSRRLARGVARPGSHPADSPRDGEWRAFVAGARWLAGTAASAAGPRSVEARHASGRLTSGDDPFPGSPDNRRLPGSLMNRLDIHGVFAPADLPSARWHGGTRRIQGRDQGGHCTLA